MWASNLLNISKKHGMHNCHSFIFWISCEDLIELIKLSDDNLELNSFRSAIKCYYDESVIYDNKNEDEKYLSIFKDRLKEILDEIEGVIKKQNIRWIIGDIDRYLNEDSTLDIT